MEVDVRDMVKTKWEGGNAVEKKRWVHAQRKKRCRKGSLDSEGGRKGTQKWGEGPRKVRMGGRKRERRKVPKPSWIAAVAVKIWCWDSWYKPWLWRCHCILFFNKMFTTSGCVGGWRCYPLGMHISQQVHPVPGSAVAKPGCTQCPRSSQLLQVEDYMAVRSLECNAGGGTSHIQSGPVCICCVQRPVCIHGGVLYTRLLSMGVWMHTQFGVVLALACVCMCWCVAYMGACVQVCSTSFAPGVHVCG